jgi:hypothetical protein
VERKCHLGFQVNLCALGEAISLCVEVVSALQRKPQHKVALIKIYTEMVVLSGGKAAKMTASFMVSTASLPVLFDSHGVRL